jgi:two-component SAPR family response regulator
MVIVANTQPRTSDAIITNFVLKEFGCFVVVSDDKLFVNILRRAIVTDLGLPSTCMGVINNQDHILKSIKEMSVRRKELLIFIPMQLNYKNIDHIIAQVAIKIRNCKIIVVTSESELHQIKLHCCESAALQIIGSQSR